MKKIFLILLLPYLSIGQSLTENFVKKTFYKIPITTSYEAYSTPSINKTETVIYHDGLGRPIQQVAYAQSNSGKDIVTHIEYDSFGRSEKEFLPFISSLSPSLNIKTNEVYSFYSANNLSLTGNPSFEITQYPFSQKEFESSPQTRLLKQSNPGDDWKMGSGNEIKFDYKTNSSSDNVKLYRANANWELSEGLYKISLIDAGQYSDNELYKIITFDENSPGGSSNIGRIEEFKNKDGKIVLKRSYVNLPNSTTLEETNTYYVYDQFGNLTYVLPPSVNGYVDDVKLNNLCYQYRYDNFNRLVEKKLPGKQWEFIVYDKLDRIVATGPAYNPYGANSEDDKGWLITKYDLFNRPVYTGWYIAPVTTTLDRKALQQSYNLITAFSESKTTSNNTINGIITKYSNVIFPSAFILLTVSYYDNYDYPEGPIVPSSLPDSTLPITSNVKGLLTGNWIRVLDVSGSTANELVYNLYDNKYRIVRAFTKNYMGGYTQVDTKLDWIGKTTYTITKHKRLATSTEIVIKDTFEYSLQDRLVKHIHKINSLPEELLTYNTYDDLGFLIKKNVGGSDITGNNTLQKVDYSYNIRGWLKGINETNSLAPTPTENDLFALKINYNDTETATPNFNGNISEMFWRTDSDNIKRKYVYQYDNLNRLIEANYSKPGSTSTPDNYLEKLSYDKSGNIQSIIRHGGNDTDGNTTAQQIDDLTYVYDSNNLNLLKNVTDNSTSPQGFNDNYSVVDDYDYDLNGNLIRDVNNNVESVLYNHLNLPRTVYLGYLGNIDYIYNALGQKVKKVINDYFGHTTTYTNIDYLSGFQYKNNTLTLFPTDEGYISVNVSSKGGTSYKYVYNYTDHLGNVRLSYSFDSSVRILEENHFYAFGLKHSNYNTEGLVYQLDGNNNVSLTPITPLLGSNYKYKYNGKEYQDELGLNWYDFGARNYNPAIGRWMNMDALSEQYETMSPYNYVSNNPVNAIDPDGKLIVYVNGLLFTEALWTYINPFKDYIPERWGTTIVQNKEPMFNGRTIDYWGDPENHNSTRYIINDMFKDDKNVFVNGSNHFNSKASDRFELGRQAGIKLIAELRDGTIKLSLGETIKVVGHSQGAAHAAGMISQLLESEYADRVVAGLYISPHQPGDFEHLGDSYGAQFSTKTDIVSSRYGILGYLMQLVNGGSKMDAIKGSDYLYIRPSFEGKKGGHDVDSWNEILKQINDFLNK